MQVRKTKKKKAFFSKNKGVQHNVFFLFSNCALQNVKSYRFLGGHFFGQIFGLFFKNTIKIGILAHFSKQNITKK